MNKRNYFSIMLLGTLLATQSAYAQKDSSGIYKTALDFQQRKLTYSINCKTENHKINSNLLFKDSDVKIQHNGTTYELKKSEIFGYRTCDEQEYRFVDGKDYKILNPGEPLTIYEYLQPTPSGKGVTKAMYKPKYFFSNTSNASVQALTKENIKALYPNNHKYHDALDAIFKDEGDLNAYDSFHKMYKLNWIIKNTAN